jgi:hypothetical protein
MAENDVDRPITKREKKESITESLSRMAQPLHRETNDAPATDRFVLAKKTPNLPRLTNLVPSFAPTAAVKGQPLALYPSLTWSEDYADPNPSESGYSLEMESPASYFRETEGLITSFDDLYRSITAFGTKRMEFNLYWRGVRNAEWGLHSYLYRRLMELSGVTPLSEKPEGAQPYPDEDQMIAAEQKILRIARTDWRFDDKPALEIFARIQHAGGPTRLLDVTLNPYIAAWFAVELDQETEGQDARLFALADRPVPLEGTPPAQDLRLHLDDLGTPREPFWHLLSNNTQRQWSDWGTGARRYVWAPPHKYSRRIPVQQAAFLFDGVPMTSATLLPSFPIEGGGHWQRADLLASASIYAKMSKPTDKPEYDPRNFAPTFSFRITAQAKAEIRETLESRFGYCRSYIYPDIEALAIHLKTTDLTT